MICKSQNSLGKRSKILIFAYLMQISYLWKCFSSDFRLIVIEVQKQKFEEKKFLLLILLPA